MRQARAVIFDMDGVIVDSEPRHERAFMEVLRELGYGDNHGFDFSQYVGLTDRELWSDFIARHNPPHAMDVLQGMKRERVLRILREDEPLFKGLPELIENLAPKYKLGLASGSEPVVVEAVLRFRHLRRYFSVVTTSSEVARGKPAPDIFLRAATLLGIAPEECWVIEDSKPGVAAGLAAGMKVIAITNTHPAQELSNATMIVKDYREIEQILLPRL
jgi:HAD superfamily hydrolase (TIGR01509 family)